MQKRTISLDSHLNTWQKKMGSGPLLPTMHVKIFGLLTSSPQCAISNTVLLISTCHGHVTS